MSLSCSHIADSVSWKYCESAEATFAVLGDGIPEVQLWATPHLSFLQKCSSSASTIVQVVMKNASVDTGVLAFSNFSKSNISGNAFQSIFGKN